MPFKVYKSLEEKSSDSVITPDFNALPVFLIPGILGNGEMEMAHIAAKLKMQHTNRKIYLWNHPQHAPQPELESEFSLIQLAQLIADEIKSLFDGPYIIAGYSAGASKAILAGRLLKDQGKSIAAICVIDSASPEMLQSYYSKNNLAATEDLIAIFKHIAAVTNIAPPGAGEPDPSALSTDTINTQATKIYDHYVNDNIFQKNLRRGGEGYQSFCRFGDVVKSEISAITEYKAEDMPRLNDINVICTPATSSKFKDDLGWSEHGHPVMKHSLALDHKLLVTEAHCQDVADILKKCFEPKSLDGGAKRVLAQAALEAIRSMMDQTAVANLFAELAKKQVTDTDTDSSEQAPASPTDAVNPGEVEDPEDTLTEMGRASPLPHSRHHSDSDDSDHTPNQRSRRADMKVSPVSSTTDPDWLAINSSTSVPNAHIPPAVVGQKLRTHEMEIKIETVSKTTMPPIPNNTASSSDYIPAGRATVSPTSTGLGLYPLKPNLSIHLKGSNATNKATPIRRLNGAYTP